METNEASNTSREIGQRIAKLRKANGLTQRDLAGILGVAQSVVSDYERGELRLHGELILHFTELFGATPNEILGIEPSSVKPKVPKNQRLYRRTLEIDKLPRRDQEALLRTIDAFLSKAN